MRVNQLFIPTLSSVVNLEEYSDKIFLKAHKIEIWHNDKLVGLVAFYSNMDEKVAFITNVSIEKEFQGKQLAKKLIEEVIQINKENNFLHILLEVHKENNLAIQFYKKNNFDIKQEKNNYFVMEYKINKNEQ